MADLSRAEKLTEQKRALFNQVVTNIKTHVDALLDAMAVETFTPGFELRETQIALLDEEHWSEEVKRMLIARLKNDGWFIAEELNSNNINIWTLSAR